MFAKSITNLGEVRTAAPSWSCHDHAALLALNFRYGVNSPSAPMSRSSFIHSTPLAFDLPFISVPAAGRHSRTSPLRGIRSAEGSAVAGVAIAVGVDHRRPAVLTGEPAVASAHGCRVRFRPRQGLD